MGKPHHAQLGSDVHTEEASSTLSYTVVENRERCMASHIFLDAYTPICMALHKTHKLPCILWVNGYYVCSEYRIYSHKVYS